MPELREALSHPVGYRGAPRCPLHLEHSATSGASTGLGKQEPAQNEGQDGGGRPRSLQGVCRGNWSPERGDRFCGVGFEGEGLRGDLSQFKSEGRAGQEGTKNRPGNERHLKGNQEDLGAGWMQSMKAAGSGRTGHHWERQPWETSEGQSLGGL